jgi:predicted permease
MNIVLQDVRHALRALRRAPGFALAAILSLALGIGANTAIYALYRSALVASLPVAEPDQLVRLRTQHGADFNENFSYPHYTALRASSAFAELLAHSNFPLALRVGNVTEQLEAATVSPNYFRALGVALPQGRSFGMAHEQPGSAAQVVVLSDAIWRRLFGQRTTVLGEVVQLNGHPFTVIGVAPASFTGLTRGAREDFWFPLASYALVTGRDYLQQPRVSWLNVVGRLHAQAPLAATQGRLQAIDGQLHQSQLLEAESRNVIVPAARGLDWLVSELEQPLHYLMAAVGLVLLIACANVASLVLARSAARRRDLAVRLALGGSRGRLLRQLLTESTTLALVAGGAGLLLASWLTDGLAAYRPMFTGTPLLLDTGPDAAVLLFTLGITLLTGLLFGLGPALQATPRDLMPLLKESTGRVTARLNARGLLVVVQVALSLSLLVGASLLARTLNRLGNVELGFDTRTALLASFDLDAGGYAPERGRILTARLLERVRAVPGVIAASAASTINPAQGGSRWDGVGIEGSSIPDDQVGFDLNVIDDQYFATLGLPIVQGRAFSAADQAGSTPVTIINEEMARRYWPGQSPIGRRIIVDREQNITWQVIGVARDGKYRGLRESPETNLWRPLAQMYRPHLTLIVHTRADPLQLTDIVRAELRSLDPAVPLFNALTLEQHIALATAQERMAAQLASAFSILALLLSIIGLYGLLAFTVAQHTREIGVRMALGAPRASVLKDVMGRGLLLVGIGLAAGMPVALWTARLLGSMLYGIADTDPLSFAAAATVLSAAGCLAALLPARRALAVDPLIALRAD